MDFTASWCGPCRTIAPYFSELAKNHPGVMFLKVDVDELNVNIFNLLIFNSSRTRYCCSSLVYSFCFDYSSFPSLNNGFCFSL